MKVFLNWLRELVVAPFEGDRESLALVPVRHDEWQHREHVRRELAARSSAIAAAALELGQPSSRGGRRGPEPPDLADQSLAPYLA